MPHTRFRRGLFALCFGLSLSLGQHHNTSALSGKDGPRRNSQSASPQALKPGDKLEREIKGGQVHSYRTRLEASEYVEFRIEKHGINPPLTIMDPAGKKLFEAKFEELSNGETHISFLAEAGGEYLLTVEPSLSKVPPGRYALSMSQPRPASETDRRRFRAQSAFLEAVELNKNGSHQTRTEALKRLEESLALWRGLEDRIWEGRVVFWQGWICFWMTDFARSHEFLSRALEIRRAAQDRMGEADVLRAIGIIHLFQGQNAKAAERLNQALKIQLDFPEPWQQGFTQVELGKIYWRLNDQEKGQRFFDEGVQNLHATGAEESEMEALSSLATLLCVRGDLQPAMDIIHRALPVFQAAGNVYAEAISYMNLGSIYYNLGERARAYEYFIHSLSLARQKKLNYDEPNALINLGIVKSSMGEREEAVKHFSEALDQIRKIPNHRAESNLLRYLGEVYLDSGKDREASDAFNQALERARKDGILHVEGMALRGLGEIQARSGDRSRAIETLKLSVDRLKKARDGNGVPRALYALSKVERQSSALSEAKGHLEEALDLIEKRRATVVGTDLRISYLAVNQSYFEEYIDLLMELHERDPGAGFDALALQAGERARARALLDSLAENRAEIRRGSDPELIAREASLQRRVSSLETQRLKLITPAQQPEQIQALDKALDAALADLQQTQAKIRVSSPRYADLIQPRPLELKLMQAQLDPDTLLLVYKLGLRRSFLWVVSPSGLESYVLPAKTELAREADSFHEILSRAPEPAAKQDEEEVIARQLYDRLLGPAAGKLGKNRLVVVADGALQLTPFAALIDSQTGQRLIEKNEVVYLPSISSLALLREAASARKPAPKTLAVLADPVFELSDPRLKGKVSAPPSNRPDPRRAALRSAEVAGDVVLRRLELSREEANQIASLTSPAMNTKLLDFAASRASLESMDLRQYRILHIATHGVLNPKRPELSGLVLSLYDERGKPQDGFLAAHDVYNLEIGADLVTLSACQTARGKEVFGEGILGLAHGFLYAGAPRLVASLWKVDDLASARFMSRFYKGMLEQGLSPAAALRKAQIYLQNSRDWAAPYYWAGFTLQGEYRPAPIGKQ